ncbi:MAG: leucine-rich repeat domain-containing protein [Bacilli bacterium]|nr:leucine-rich repeat domain-containing protein [Bacilli bacterium]
MTKRPREVYGKKLIYRYSTPVILTLLTSLLAIGIFVATLFVPYIHGEVDLNGLHLVKYVINFFTGEANPEINYYVNDIVTKVFDGNEIAKPIAQIWIFTLVIDLVFISIFIVILTIAALILIFSGRLKHWKLPFKCISTYFWLGVFFFYSTVIALNIYAALVKKVAYYDGLFAYIFLGALLVLTIFTYVVYRKGFKGRVYVKNERTLNMYVEEYEREHMVVDTTDHSKDEIEEAPKIIMMPAEDQEEKNESSDNRKTLPRGLKHIGGHAFSQNTALEEADIPLGIEVLGAGAFANCVNLKIVHIPESVKKIEYNCFFNCIRLERITYGGSREMWKRVKRGSNWLTAAGTKFVVCRDGALAVNPEK